MKPARLEKRRIEDLASQVEDFLLTHPQYVDGPRSLTKSEYRYLDPIILDDTDELLDGYHRLAGLVGAGETGDIEVIVIYDEDLAADISEPGWRQDEALEMVHNDLLRSSSVVRSGQYVYKLRTALRIINDHVEEEIRRILQKGRGVLSVSEDGYLEKAQLSDRYTILISRETLSLTNMTLVDPKSYKAVKLLHELDPSISNWKVTSDSPQGPTVENFIKYWREYANLREKVEKGDFTFLHGTSTELWKSIQHRGLRPRKFTGRAPSHYRSEEQISQEHLVYLALDEAENTARFAARDAARNHGGDPLILVVAGGLDPAKLHPDEDTRADTWEESLRLSGTVAYSGIIHPSNLYPHMVLTDSGWKTE